MPEPEEGPLTNRQADVPNAKRSDLEAEIRNETRMPSFFRGWRYVRKLLDIFGAQEFPVPDYES
jgi:hypothetical protein